VKDWKIIKDLHRQIYGLTPLQQRWSTFKVRLVLRAKWPAKAAKNYFYAELLRRQRGC
jgi:hypothetical protein